MVPRQGQTCRGYSYVGHVPLRRQGPSQAPQEPSKQRRIEVVPVGIHLLDFAQLPNTLPLLHLEFAQTSLVQVVVSRIPDEQLAPIFPREAADETVAVLPRALHEIARDPDVQGAVSSARHDVDVAGLHGPNM